MYQEETAGLFLKPWESLPLQLPLHGIPCLPQRTKNLLQGCTSQPASVDKVQWWSFKHYLTVERFFIPSQPPMAQSRSMSATRATLDRVTFIDCTQVHLEERHCQAILTELHIIFYPDHQHCKGSVCLYFYQRWHAVGFQESPPATSVYCMQCGISFCQNGGNKGPA